ncbi:MAG: hypothetical protein WCX73_02110 [Candidatus Pacearchaeota archaeon]|jgi:hypothetical protein
MALSIGQTPNKKVNISDLEKKTKYAVILLKHNQTYTDGVFALEKNGVVIRDNIHINMGEEIELAEELIIGISNNQRCYGHLGVYYKAPKERYDITRENCKKTKTKETTGFNRFKYRHK